MFVYRWRDHQTVFAKKGVEGLFSTRDCTNNQPILSQFLGENNERFFCKFDERGSADTELTEGSAVVADYQNAGCMIFLVQLRK